MSVRQLRRLPDGAHQRAVAGLDLPASSTRARISTGYTAADEVLDRLRRDRSTMRSREPRSATCSRFFTMTLRHLHRLAQCGARRSARSSSFQTRGAATSMKRRRSEHVLASQWRAADRPMRRITSRFVLLIASAAIAPLVLYGVVSIFNLQAGHRDVGQRRQPAASPTRSRNRSGSTSITTPASEIRRAGAAQASTSSRGSSHASSRTTSSIFRNSARSRSSRAGGRVIATSRVGDATLDDPRRRDVGNDGIYIAPLQIDDDGLPRTTIAVRVTPSGQEAGVGRRRDLRSKSSGGLVDRVRSGRRVTPCSSPRSSA